MVDAASRPACLALAVVVLTAILALQPRPPSHPALPSNIPSPTTVQSAAAEWSRRLCAAPVTKNVNCTSSEPLQRLVPSFAVIGVAKGGTTSLYAYLKEHPNVLHVAQRVCQQRQPLTTWPTRHALVEDNGKEVHYLSSDSTFSRTRLSAAVTADGHVQPQMLPPAETQRLLSNYLEFFPVVPKRVACAYITGEATPYLGFDAKVPYRLRAMLPDTKLIMLLREPGARTVSQYDHATSMAKWTTEQKIKHLNRTMETMWHSALSCINNARPATDFPLDMYYPVYRCYEARLYQSTIRQDLNGNVPAFLWNAMLRSMYYLNVAPYFDVFPREQLLIFRSENFADDAATHMTTVADFLHLPPFDWAPIVSVRYNTAAARPGMSNATLSEKQRMYEAVAAELKRRFRPFNERLCRLLAAHNISFEPW